jgi:hypothetical protein
MKTGLGGDDKSRGNRETHTGHFRQPRSFPSKEFLMGPFCLFKKIDIFQTFHGFHFLL